MYKVRGVNQQTPPLFYYTPPYIYYVKLMSSFEEGQADECLRRSSKFLLTLHVMPPQKRTELTEQQKKAADLYVLDTFARKQKTHKSYIAQKVGVKEDTVVKWFMRSEPFKEYVSQELARIKDNFNDLPMAMRRTRIQRLTDLYDTIEDRRVDLKIKVLREIREEVGDHKVHVEVEHKGNVAVAIPPRPDSYEEWLEQNKLAQQAVDADWEETNGQQALLGQIEPQAQVEAV